MIKGIITDFDGTLVDTLYANTISYVNTFKKNGYNISKDQYIKCFGLRYDDLCDALNIPNEQSLRDKIKSDKKEEYKLNYNLTKLNNNLLYFIKYSKMLGLSTCITSTASKDNLFGILNYYNITQCFDYIICGNEVKNGKPAPDVYLKALLKMGLNSENVIVFEDSQVGFDAAKNAGINNIIKIVSI